MRTKAFAVAIVLLAFSRISAAADPTVGTWKLNSAKSKYTPAAQVHYETIAIEAAGDAMKITLDGTDSTGKKIHAEWTGKYDGKDYPVKGNPETETLAYRKVDDTHYVATNKRGGKATSTANIVYSADGKTRTVTASGTNPKGEKTSSTAVYDKQ